MDANVHWSVWLLSGMAVGMASGLGKSGLSGLIVGIAVLSSPLVIYMNAGAVLMPYVLFYGGLVVMSSLLFKRRRIRENAKVDSEIEQRKKRLSR